MVLHVQVVGLARARGVPTLVALSYCLQQPFSHKYVWMSHLCEARLCAAFREFDAQRTGCWLSCPGQYQVVMSATIARTGVIHRTYLEAERLVCVCVCVFFFSGLVLRVRP